MGLRALWFPVGGRQLHGGDTSRKLRGWRDWGVYSLGSLLGHRSAVGVFLHRRPQLLLVTSCFTQSHSSLWVLATTPSPCLVSSKGSNSSQTLRVSGPHHPFLVFSHPTHNCINSLFINLSSVTPISVYKHPDDITYYP